MESAIHEVCDLAAKKNVALLPGAELSHTNAGLDSWTLDLQRRYNTVPGRRPIMYTTYQAYLKSTPARLARDLEIARNESFTLAVKLVRGAYLASEPKDIVCASKEETDEQYDGLMEAVLRRRYNTTLKPTLGVENTGFPAVALMIASHNAPSVQKAQKIRNEQTQRGEERIECAFSQLQGMADEISCELVRASKSSSIEDSAKEGTVSRPQAFKCATWGTMTECLQFLLRRAAENQDAAGRTAETRRAMGNELWRRWRTAFGLA
jgi:proline dehydrogenase